MQNLVRKFYTESEYLELEKTAEYKSEYYKGEAFPIDSTKISLNLEDVYEKVDWSLLEEKGIR